MAGNARRNSRSRERFGTARTRRAQRPLRTNMVGRRASSGELKAALRHVGTVLGHWVLERRWYVIGGGIGLLLFVGGLVVSPRITISVVLAGVGLAMLALDRRSRRR
jgi:Flp pilus assembly protein TadB